MDVLHLEPVLLGFLGYEVLLGDLQLLLCDVARDFDELHTVTQGGGDSGDIIRRSDEEDLREVVVDIEIVIVEGGILLGVEDFQESRCGIALVVVSELIDLVEDEDGVRRASLLQALDDTAAHRTYIGTAVTTDLSLIMHPTEGDTHVLTAEALCDATPKGGLTYPWRAIEAEDGGLHIALELQYRQVLEDTLLDAVEAIVLAVKDLLRPLEVEVILTEDTPRQLEDRAQILHLDREVGALRIEALSLTKLLLIDLSDGFAPELFLTLLAKLFDLVISAGASAELLLDGTHLLLEEVLTLLLIHLTARAIEDLLTQRGLRDLVMQTTKHIDSAVVDTIHLEELLTILHTELKE